MVNTRLLWILAGGACIVATIPWRVLLLAPCCLVAFVVGFLGYIVKKEYDLKSHLHVELMTFTPATGIPSLVKELHNKIELDQLDRRMTGSTLIDDVLHEIIDYVYRDYINSWFKNLSRNDAKFKVHTRASLQYMITRISDRIKDVDLVKFLSEDLVDLVTTHIQIYRQALEKAKNAKGNPKVDDNDLEKYFFQLEESTTKKNLCREDICSKKDNEKEYIRVVSETLLYLLLPEVDFNNKSLRYIMREIITNGILIPFVNDIAQSDYINETILHCFGDSAMTSDTFQVVVRHSTCVEELREIGAQVRREITRQRGRDADDGDGEVKRGLASLAYVYTCCDKRLHQLQQRAMAAAAAIEDSTDAAAAIDAEVDAALELDDERYAQRKAYNLPYDVTIQNTRAVSYFVEFLKGVGGQPYMFFYLAVAGYRSSTRAQTNLNDSSDMDIIREAAITIYNEYISEKNSSCIELDSITQRQLKHNVFHESPCANVFDEVQLMVSNILKYDPRYYTAFRNNIGYIQMLTQLDLPREGADLDQLHSADRKNSPDSYDGLYLSTQLTTKPVCESNMSAQITNTGTCQEYGQTYTIYFISVKRNKGEYQESWDIYRRYSDFHDMHMTINDKYPSMTGLNLPGKKTFNNMNKDFLEKRSEGLNTYLQNLLSNRILKCHAGLERIVTAFLDNVALEKDKNAVIRKIVNPLKASVASVGNIVKSMPDNVIGGVTRVGEGILSFPNSMIDGMGRILQNKGDNDNLPLRIMLQMMDEIFDLRLKTRSDWLYKKIVDIIRGIIKKFYGDNLNRDSFWPDGVIAPAKETRDASIKLRTQVVCKTKLINTITEELRTVMGTEVTRKGALRVFTMLQNQRLNKRLIFVIIEGVLTTLFPDNKFDVLFDHMLCKENRNANK